MKVAFYTLFLFSIIGFSTLLYAKEESGTIQKNNTSSFYDLVFNGKKPATKDFEVAKIPNCITRFPGKAQSFHISYVYRDLYEEGVPVDPADEVPVNVSTVYDSEKGKPRLKRVHCSVDYMLSEIERHKFTKEYSSADKRSERHRLLEVKSFGSTSATRLESVGDDTFGFLYEIKNTNSNNKARCHLSCGVTLSKTLKLTKVIQKEFEEFTDEIAKTVEVKE